MKTVKEVAKISGVSVRTLRYYDEIGLLKPTTLTDAGYRLYDEEAIYKLHQILFYREFEIPLKEIQTIMETPSFQKEEVLSEQKKILKQKIKRLNKLVQMIDSTIKGERVMDFSVFQKSEIEQMVELLVCTMSKEMKQEIVKEYGDMESYKQQFITRAGKEKMQKSLGKLVEWYKDPEENENSVEEELIDSCNKRLDAAYRKLALLNGKDLTSFEVRSKVGEIDFVLKLIYQMDDVQALLLQNAEECIKDRSVREQYDSLYGPGSAVFIHDAIVAFYKE